MSNDTTTKGAVYLLYDGECPFCSKTAKYHKLKAAFPNISLISLRDKEGLKSINIPSEINPDNGMILVLPGEKFMQGTEAFIELNKEIGKNDLFHRLLSIKIVASIIYPCLLILRRFALFLNGSEAHIQKV